MRFIYIISYTRIRFLSWLNIAPFYPASVRWHMGQIAINTYMPDNLDLPWRIWVNVSHESKTWWRHQREAFSALLAICAGNSPVTGELPAQRPVMRGFDVFFDLRLNRRLSIDGWVNNGEAGVLRRHCAHYDVIVRKDRVQQITAKLWAHFIWSLRRHCNRNFTITNIVINPTRAMVLHSFWS